MMLAVERVDGITVVELQGDYLDASVAETFKRKIALVLETNRRVLLNMQQVQFVDSAGIGALVSCLRRVSAAGGELKLCAMSKTVRMAFEIVRMHRIFETFDTREDAIRAFEPS
jgi:anti-sigma B factor antagonist